MIFFQTIQADTNVNWLTSFEWRHHLRSHLIGNFGQRCFYVFEPTFVANIGRSQLIRWISIVKLVTNFTILEQGWFLNFLHLHFHFIYKYNILIFFSNRSKQKIIYLLYGQKRTKNNFYLNIKAYLLKQQ